MAYDENGYDKSHVLIPKGGATFVAPLSVEKVAKADMITPGFRPPVGANSWRQLELRTEDGGPEWTNEDDGDPIVFYDAGYSIPSGLSNVTLTETVAFGPVARELAGFKPDSTGYGYIKGGSSGTEWRVYHIDLFSAPDVEGMVIMARQGIASVSVTEPQQTRGQVKPAQVVFTFRDDMTIGGNKLEQVVLYPTEAPEED